MLNQVVFPNRLPQRIIQILSLSRPARGKCRRGRISHAQLGIYQLGTLSEDRFMPWFGLQLWNGNSLVGAGREFYPAEALSRKGKDPECWLNCPLKRLNAGEARGEGRIWHFLLPAAELGKYSDKVAKQLYREPIKTIDQWRRDFIKPFRRAQITRLKRAGLGIFSTVNISRVIVENYGV